MTSAPRVPVDSGLPRQSAWEALSRAGEQLDGVTLLLLALAATLLAAASLLAIHAVRGCPRTVDTRRWLMCGGLLAPTLVWTVCIAYALAVDKPRTDATVPAVQVQLNGRQWWWEVRYIDRDGRAVTLANELRLPLGEPVAVRLTSSDVVHAFWVPALAGRIEMVPGRVEQLRMTATQAGVHRGQCAQFCGTQHALMALHVVVEEGPAFRAWLARQAEPALPPADASLRQGRDVFLHAGCAGCHTVRGTEARGEIGPDLTHVGSRRALAAGTLRNHLSALSAWVANSQRIKPGSLMPSTGQLRAEDLDALAAYLVSLQ
jgi:cytochrome c oxidase subunit II